jgi:hypothetical protein
LLLRRAANCLDFNRSVVHVRTLNRPNYIVTIPKMIAGGVAVGVLVVC